MPSHPTSIWSRSPNKLRQSEIWLNCFYFTSLFLASLILFLINLGGLPLLDSNEGIVAQVAKEIYQQSHHLSSWIFPTLWGEAYLEQPPLIHGLVAIAYLIAGVNEFTTRLPGALLGAMSVVFMYKIGREIFVARFPALCSALIYLTCLPVVRSSRLAMSDGPLLCFELITIWAILRSRRDLRWSLVAGIGLGLMSLTKGVVALQIAAVIVGFLFWDTPRLLASPYFLGGIVLGAAPGISWYVAQSLHYYELNAVKDMFDLFMGRISIDRLDFKFSPLYYLIQSLQYIFPWIIIMFAGLKLASRSIHWGWGKLIVVWLGVYLTIILLGFDGNYGFILPLYPGLALAGGKQLDLIRNLPSYIEYPADWTYGFILMAVIAAFAGLHWGIRNYIDFYLPFICGSLAITFAATAIVIAQQEKQFIPLLFWGLFVSMFLLFISPHWIWELKAVEPVKPIAALIRQYTPKNQVVYSAMSQKRPSLEFYSDRRIINRGFDDLKAHWQEDPKHNLDVYLLVDAAAIEQLNIPMEMIFANPQSDSVKWMLAIKKT